MEGRIEGALLDLKAVFRNLLDAEQNTIAVERPK
jgi:hypothetical protein